MTKRLTDLSALSFDCHGTLIDMLAAGKQQEEQGRA